MPRLAQPFLFALALLLVAFPTRADRITELYTTQAIVTGTGEENRKLGFAICFDAVLMRVSGDPTVLDEPRVAALRPSAGEFVAEFRYKDRYEGIPVHDEQGTHDRPHDLTCIFDRARVDALLAELGRQPGLAERPRLAMVLGVQNAKGEFMLSGDGEESPYMRDSLAAAALPLALEVRLPDRAALGRSGLAFGTLGGAAPETLVPLAESAGAELALAGTLVWSDAELGWIADWQLTHRGATHRWQVRGVSFDEAFRVALRGAARILSGNGAP